jgi:hypothetical protein
MGDMSGEYASHGKTEIFSFQELCSDPCDMVLCIMLKHEVMAADEWHNFDISKLLAPHDAKHCLPSAPVQLKTGKAHFSSVPVAIEGEHLPTEVGYDAELQSGQDPGEDGEEADDFP